MHCTLRFSIILILTLCLAFVAAAQSKTSSSSVQMQPVKFDGHEVQLAGTLAVPKLEAGKRAPAVLMVTGVTAPIRNGADKPPTYHELAEHLAGRGMAVLRYDKRCFGESECKPPATFDDYVDDARKATDFLKKQPQVDPAKVFLFGHDEGGYIVASLASFDDSKFAGVVLAATSGRTLGKLLREQVQTHMTAAGKTAAEVNAYLVKFDGVIRGLMLGKGNYSDEKLDAKDPYDAMLLDLIKRREIIISLLINDPLQVVNGIQAPILILQGKKDSQIGIKDAQYIEEALKRASHPDVTLQLFDDVDHLLKSSKGAADALRPLDAGVLTLMTEWIQKRAK